MSMITFDPRFRPKLGDIRHQFKVMGSAKEKLDKYSSLNDLQAIILKNDNYRQYFKEFLRTEYAVETLLFYEDQKIFSKLTSDQEKFWKVEEMCETYLYDTSPLEINIGGPSKVKFFKELEEAKICGEIEDTIFDEIVKHIIDTIMLDSFPRFERSEINQELENCLNQLK